MIDKIIFALGAFFAAAVIGGILFGFLWIMYDIGASLHQRWTKRNRKG